MDRDVPFLELVAPRPPQPFNLRISALPQAFIFVIKRLMMVFWAPAFGSWNEQESLCRFLGGRGCLSKAAVLQAGQLGAGPPLARPGLEGGLPSVL